MMITASREDFVTALTRAAQGLPARPVNPAHAGMLVTASEDGYVHLTCGDDQMMFAAALDCHEVSPGGTVLPGKMLAEMTRYFPGSKDIRLEVTGTVATITAGRSVFTLPADDPEDYPVLSQELPALAWAPEQGDFALAVRRVLAAAARNDPVLSCVCVTVSWEGLTLVCTDRYGMGITAVHAAPVTGDALPAALIPSGVAERLAKVLDGDGEMQIGWDDRLVVMGAPGLSVITRQVAGKFVPWENIMAKKPPVPPVTVPVPELVRAVSMAALAAAPATSITLDFDHADLTVSAAGSASVSEYLETSYDGDPVRIIISAKMLLDALSACGEHAGLRFAGPCDPVFITGDEVTWMVQPYRSPGEG